MTQRLCVFCGSSPGSDPAYRAGAVALGQALLARGIGLVYGGGRVGLMGVIAETVLAGGGEVIGVIPRKLLELEVGDQTVTELHVVETMHQRKALMSELSDGFIAMPGGLGTLEELFEMLTWAQLGIHRKPVGILNVAGYYDGLLTFIAHAIEQQFVHDGDGKLVKSADSPAALLALFDAHQPHTHDKAAWALDLSDS
jgi:uncharacterized protein (TIGR00730 family)